MTNYSDNDLQALYDDPDFYEAEFGKLDIELPFLESICKGRESVLEVACGSGRLSIPLLQQGIDIDGFDLSPAMIQLANEKANALGFSSRFQVADARNFAESIIRQYDLIFASTNCLQHLLSAAELEAFFRSAQQRLKKNGLLVIDLQNPDPVRLARPANEVREYKAFKVNGRPVYSTIQTRYAALEQIYYLELSYFDGLTAKPIKTKSVAMRMYYPREIEYIIEKSGFRIQELYGGYDRSGSADKSLKLIYFLSLNERYATDL